MLPSDKLTLAIEIHQRSYKLLRWVSDAIHKGFISVSRAHENGNVADNAFEWIEQHYFNLPPESRPDRSYLREFSNFFSTYVLTSFDLIQSPGNRLRSDCGCYCPWCSRIVSAPYFQPKKLTKRDHVRAGELIVDRMELLALEEDLPLLSNSARALSSDPKTKLAAAYSTYGYWLIQRLNADVDGKSILALWRAIAWDQAGSPKRKFRLQFKDFVDAEEILIHEMRTVQQQ